MTKICTLATLTVISMALIVSTGCTSANVSVSPMLKSYADCEVAVIDVTPPTKQGLKWTVLLAGRIKSAEPEDMVQSIERGLIDAKLFDIVDGSRLKKIVHDRNLRPVSLMDNFTAIELGKLAGLDGIVVVSTEGGYDWLVPFYDASHKTSAKLIDVESGQIVWSADSSHYTCGILPLPLIQSSSSYAYRKMSEEISEELHDRYRQMGPAEE